jgi:DNA polymerase II large subunit
MSELAASPRMQAYFASLEKECKRAYEIAQKARAKGYDPQQVVEIRLARNMAERVIGIISVAAPQIIGKGAEQRIIELEQQYGAQDWRVALVIAEEVAREKFCTFKDKKEAMEMGIRTGFTYATVGVVSSPLEGFTSLDIKPRRDGTGSYFCMNYAGPVRNAGGTAAAVSVIIGDYIRVKFGYAPYDPDEKEIKRTHVELEDYHEYVTNLQYFPTKEEVDFMMQHLPVEISGDPSEKYKISNINLRNLPRVSTDLIRSGFCLIHSSCIPLKAPKLWKQLGAWGEEFGMGHWKFLEEFLKIQKKMKAQGKKKEGVTADFTFIHDLVAGRPVFGHPIVNGGFRLRYGRARTSGYSAQAVHPATMIILDNFLATATQLKVERPGKAAAFSACDTLDGPIVKLNDGSVIALNSEDEAKHIRTKVKEILYLGDVLINYGDFFNRAHPLVPPGYCPEYWSQELEEAQQQTPLTISPNRIQEFITDPLHQMPTPDEAILLARDGVPLHPLYTYFWNTIDNSQLEHVLGLFANARYEDEKIIIALTPENHAGKRALELLGIPHVVVNKEYAVISQPHTSILKELLGFAAEPTPAEAKTRVEELLSQVNQEKTSLDNINSIAPCTIRDKCGVFIGSRMGRPEKAKMRKMAGSPHVLFPVGGEGGRLRSFQQTLEEGKITGEFVLYFCPHCAQEVIHATCPHCDKPTEKLQYCKICGSVKTCAHEGKTVYKRMEIPIAKYFEDALARLKTKIFPDLIKGVKGTSNKNHHAEHLVKGILRAKHDVCVNKDGTTRYDASEVTLTHFKPCEVRTSVQKLIELGYDHDIHHQPLVDDNQVLELFPQDVVLPCCDQSPDDPCDKVLCNVANFIDELLYRHYKIKPYHHVKTPEDLVGQLIIGLAPHTSAGILGRIVGFSNTQSFFAHPYYHAAMRRDCDGDESCIFLLMDGLLNFSREYLPDSRGSTMDAPLVLTYLLNPAEVDDMAFHMDIVWKYPLAFYRAAEQMKMPWEVPILQIGKTLATPAQFEGMGYTHETTNFNAGVVCSAYKLLPSMDDKLKGQMALATKIRAVDERDVARLVIEKHFIRDTKGNLRKFSQQEFRCVSCNLKYRRPPLIGKCVCGGKLLFTISEGSITKYLEASIELAEKYNVAPYLKQSLELTKRRVEAVFGKEKEVQQGLGSFIG